MSWDADHFLHVLMPLTSKLKPDQMFSLLHADERYDHIQALVSASMLTLLQYDAVQRPS